MSAEHKFEEVAEAASLYAVGKLPRGGAPQEVQSYPSRA